MVDLRDVSSEEGAPGLFRSSYSRWNAFIVSFSIFFFSLLAPAAPLFSESEPPSHSSFCDDSSAVPEINLQPELSTDGVYSIHWKANSEGEPVLLQESTVSDFSDGGVTVYRGSDAASSFSGKPDGTYYYRIRYESGDPETFACAKSVVKHHSLLRAFGFLITGGIVFLSTVFLIFMGTAKEYRGRGI